jgi:iron(III) transport system substrate-binding protein
MFKNLAILLSLAVIIAIPFALRQKPDEGAWRKGDPELVIISPHNEAIRFEFGRAFTKWHEARFKRPDGTPQPVRIDWRNIGGTTEIGRYLQSEYATSTQAWWRNKGKAWPTGATDSVVAGKKPADPALVEIYDEYRKVDDPRQITSKVDLFFGGGQFDHNDAFVRGFGVPPWPADAPPADVAPSLALIPPALGGEIWRTPTLFGTAISTFGIVYNVDRLQQLNVSVPPRQWADLADFRYFRQVGVTDPTKSGSIAKAFEMLLHQQMRDAVAAHLRAARVREDRIDQTIADYEAQVVKFQKDSPDAKRWETPPGNAKLAAYQAALEQGFVNGLRLIQAIGANARYFTDSATKVSLDVSIGDAAVGMSIDFYGRYQAQSTLAPDGTPRMKFVTPVGGTSVSCDPITLLRGAPHRDLAVRFITFTLSEDGQRIWTYQPGTPGGPEKYALRRLPIRRDFYPSTQPAQQARHAEHAKYAADDLTDPTIDPYQVSKSFTYYPRWTLGHFSILREIIRSMCLDSGEELRDAWARYHTSTAGRDTTGGALGPMPTVTLYNKDTKAREDVPMTWRAMLGMKSFNSLEYQREWTAAFRKQYHEVAR